MSEANRSLQEFVTFLYSPDMYGSMSLAAQMLKWAVHAVVTILMLAAVIAVLFVVLKFACDVIFLTGVGNLMTGSRAATFKQRVEKFASNGAVEGDIKKYIKEDLWKPIVTLAFIGLLASGMALPLAGQLAGMIGAGIDKMIGLDPATQIANFDYQEFTQSVKYTRSNDLKQQYDKYVSEASAYRDYIYDLGTKNPGENNPTLQKYKTLYTGAMMKAQAVSLQMNNTKTLQELKVPSDYFKQHTKNGMCQSLFMDSGTKSAFTGVSSPC